MPKEIFAGKLIRNTKAQENYREEIEREIGAEKHKTEVREVIRYYAHCLASRYPRDYEGFTLAQAHTLIKEIERLQGMNNKFTMTVRILAEEMEKRNAL